VGVCPPELLLPLVWLGTSLWTFFLKFFVWVGGEIPYPFSSQLISFTLFKKDLASYSRILFLDFCFGRDRHVFKCYKFERRKRLKQTLRPTLDKGPGSNFLGTNLDWFDANWILELDSTLVPSLTLGSPNQELALLLALFFGTSQLIFPPKQVPCRFSVNLPFFGLGPSSKGLGTNLKLSTNKVAWIHCSLDLGPSSKVAFKIWKKLKPWRLPKVKGSILKYRVPPLWPTYIGERRTTFGKAYGIKLRCYGEHVGEHIGNQMRTHWELGKHEKKSFSPPSPHTN
jgi:hypothetical protein